MDFVAIHHTLDLVAKHFGMIQMRITLLVSSQIVMHLFSRKRFLIHATFEPGKESAVEF
jgi:hypothetical protein